MGGKTPLHFLKKMNMDNTEARGKAIFGSIALVVGVVILVAIAGLITGSVLSSSVFNDVTTTAIVSNETLANVDNLSITSFAVLSSFSGASCTLNEVINTTDGVVITAGNYTQPTSCTILGTNESIFNGVSWNVSYNYTNTATANVAGVNITLLTNGFSAFVVGIVTFLGIIGIIIGIVWLISYLRPLFSKDDGIQSFAGS